jgi:hypothetical protein
VLVHNGQILSACLVGASKVTRLDYVNQGVVEHELAACVRTAVTRRAGNVPKISACYVVFEIVKPVFRHALRAEPKMHLTRGAETWVIVPNYVVVNDIRRVRWLIGSISRGVVVTLKNISVCRPGWIVEMFKNIIMDVMAPLANTLRHVTNYRVLEVVETWEARPCTSGGI